MRFQGEQVLHAAWSWLHGFGLLDLVCLMLCCLILPASCYAAWTSQSCFVLVFVFMIVLCCLALSSWCCAAWPLYIMPCYLANVFWAPKIHGTTSFSRLVSAARSVTHFWFQIEINAAEVRRPKLQILWWTWLSETQITFIKQKPTQIYCIVISLPQRA